MSHQSDRTDQERVFSEFSPKTAILQARSLARYVLSKWLFIFLIAFLFGSLAAAYYFFKKPLFEAELTFTLDEGAAPGNDGSSISGIGAQLGLGRPPTSGGVFSNMSNIIELMQSRLLIRKTLLSEHISSETRSVSFADFFLDSLGYREDWIQNSNHPNLKFLQPKKDNKEERFQNDVLERMYNIITKKIIKISPKGEGTTIISVSCISEHELFSKYFLEALIEEVSEYYIETKTLRAKTNLSFIQHRTDSIRLAYNRALFGKAAFTDANINPNLKIATVSGEKQQTDLQLLSASYMELVRSLEAAKTTLMRETPLIQLLDIPILPLKRTAPNLPFMFIIFAIVGAILAIGFFILKRIFKKLMQS